MLGSDGSSGRTGLLGVLGAARHYVIIMQLLGLASD